jgi:hypothetical protein
LTCMALVLISNKIPVSSHASESLRTNRDNVHGSMIRRLTDDNGENKSASGGEQCRLLSRTCPQFRVLRNLHTLKIFGLLAMTIWIAHFWYSASFGLYADDYFTVASSMISGSEFWSYIQRNVVSFAHGRPIGYISVGLLSYLGAKLGGLKIIYFFSYVIATINSCLFYTLLRRLSGCQLFALTGALGFALFPGDTTRAFLTHLQVYPSLMFLLIAFHCYLSGRTKLSYAVILGALLSYETVVPVFLAAPLLKRKWDRKLIREWIGHALVLAGMIVCVVIVRKTLGDTRIASLDPVSTIAMSTSHMIRGPLTSIKMFLYRPVKAVQSLNVEPVLLCMYFAGLAWMLSRLNLKVSGDALRLMSVERKECHCEMHDVFRHLTRLATLGVVMLILAYPLTLTVPATAIDGRASRVHLAAVMGASVLCACVSLTILFIAGLYRKKHLATVGLAMFFALLAGFGLVVQQDYVRSWQYQRAFWTDLIQLCPDITDETLILVEPTGLKNPKHMDAFNWAISLGLQQIYQFKPNYVIFDDSKLQPQVRIMRPGWPDNIVSGARSLELNKVTTLGLGSIGTVQSSNVILLETNSGRLTRRTDSLIIGGQEIPLKKNGTSENKPFKKGHLYHYLIRSSDEGPARYLKEIG